MARTGTTLSHRAMIRMTAELERDGLDRKGGLVFIPGPAGFCLVEGFFITGGFV